MAVPMSISGQNSIYRIEGLKELILIPKCLQLTHLITLKRWTFQVLSFLKIFFEIGPGGF